MHHSIQADLWQAIFRLSRRLEIQIFATSHSWNSVAAFQKAAAEEPEDGVLVRLSRKGDEIIPTLFREAELAVANPGRFRGGRAAWRKGHNADPLWVELSSA